MIKTSDYILEYLKKQGIKNPIHYCGNKEKHSHLKCAYYGVKLALTKKGY